jgi:hypothetical protein
MSTEILFEDVEKIPSKQSFAEELIDSFVSSGKQRVKVNTKYLLENKKIKSATSLYVTLRQTIKKLQKPVRVRFVAKEIYMERIET